MLFDLQGRGRKNVVRVIYLGLAILMGGGLVLFGIGTGGPGGLFDAFTGQGADTTSIVSESQKRAEAAVRRDPQNAAAWAQLARARYISASTGTGFDETQGIFTEQGRRALEGAAQAWRRYLALEPARPDVNVAGLMAQAYSPAGLDQPELAADTVEIITEQDPSASAFVQLAQFAYLAGQMRKGDLAAEKAIELSPRATRRSVERQLETFRRQVTQEAIERAVQDGAVSTPSG
jgi:hypothetical protein